ncbi:hypothetical protein IA829_02835 [Listeria seeligeri]|nr:hypothetical protein [Listeria seeligeri]MBC2213085.1 hypothetical protein [Listeria seeligeri]MBF2474864.1 hypothetical protein [Listeria seeligeri]MBF2572497.1 hypothetical protein [Listeria seeligeri]MBF2663802.1 hypothetical protein [Listeria seeligeri]
MKKFKVETILKKWLENKHFVVEIINETDLALKKIEFTAKGSSCFFCFEESEVDEVATMNDLHKRLIDYVVTAWDFDIYGNKQNYSLTFFEWVNEEWKEMNLDLMVSVSSINFHPKIEQKEADLLISHINGKNELPLALILLKRSKLIHDERSKFVSIITACEIGVKEFYSKKIPELGLLLDEMTSPPVVKLLGSLFKKYFEETFPKELRSKLEKMIEIRNSIVHRSAIKPTHTELLSCYVVVLKTLNFLNKKSDNGFYNEYYDEEVSFEPIESTGQLQINGSDKLNKAVEEGKIIYGFDINSEYIIND